MSRLLYIGLGGFIGAIARHIVSGWALNLFGQRLPFGTLFVNLTGCFAIGFVMTYSLEVYPVSPNVRFFLATGIVGGYTTFSTFGYETLGLIQEGSYLLGLWNVLLNVVLGLAAVWLGTVAARLLG